MSFVREKLPTPHTSRPIGVTSHTTPLSIRRGAGGEASPIEVTTHTMPLPAGDRLRRDQLWKGGKTTSFHSLHQFYQEIYPYFLRRKKRTNRKFIGTQIANIGIKANCLLSPNQRKSCRKVLCKTQLITCEKTKPNPRFVVDFTRKVYRVEAIQLNVKLTR